MTKTSNVDDDRYTRITLRIPKELHARLQEMADASSKSMNAEIVARLEASFAPAQAKPDTDQSELLSVRNAQLSIVLTGLNLAEMAAKFVASEVPAVRKSTSFPKLKESLAAVRTVVVHGTTSYNDSLVAAGKSLEGMKAINDSLGSFKRLTAPGDH